MMVARCKDEVLSGIHYVTYADNMLYFEVYPETSHFAPATSSDGYKTTRAKLRVDPRPYFGHHILSPPWLSRPPNLPAEVAENTLIYEALLLHRSYRELAAATELVAYFLQRWWTPPSVSVFSVVVSVAR